jgi:hypothetical protein
MKKHKVEDGNIILLSSSSPFQFGDLSRASSSSFSLSFRKKVLVVNIYSRLKWCFLLSISSFVPLLQLCYIVYSASFLYIVVVNNSAYCLMLALYAVCNVCDGLCDLRCVSLGLSLSICVCANI